MGVACESGESQGTMKEGYEVSTMRGGGEEGVGIDSSFLVYERKVGGIEEGK